MKEKADLLLERKSVTVKWRLNTVLLQDSVLVKALTKKLHA